MTRHHSCRVSPFGHPRINARLTAPRGITQPPTSFIGSQCQGIHHALLNTYNTKNQFEKRNCTSTHKPRQPPYGSRRQHLRARCSQPLSTNQTPHPTTKMAGQHHLDPTAKDNQVLPQDPTVCLAPRCLHQEDDSLLRTQPAPTTDARLLTARARPDASPISWCSLERR